jgi:hypothetical protein
MARPAPDLFDTKRRAALARLHLVKKERRLDDEDWRDIMERVTGARSLKDLDARQLYALLDALHAGGASVANKVSAQLTGPYAAKLRALWISGWQLGVIRSRGDDALLAFVKRMTGVDHTRFLIDAREAAKVIEALKQMLARDGGVAWEDHEGQPRMAILAALWRSLRERGVVGFFCPGDTEQDAMERYVWRVAGKNGWSHCTDADFDKVNRVLGERLRAEISRELKEASNQGEDHETQ